MQGKRAFQRMTKLDGSSNPTSEEFHYYYDTQGRLLFSAFAQDPDDWTPSSGNSFYDSSHHADYRCLATYAYDAAGRLGSLGYTWQTWVPSGESGSYSTTGYIAGYEYDYELSGLNRSLRTDFRVFGPNGGNTAFAQTRSERNEYDADLDYLTASRYNDNTTSGYEVEDEWLYDAAGNRVSETHDTSTTSPVTSTAFTYDNLNRMTESPSSPTTSYTYYNDILGNRLERGDQYTNGSGYATYLWDDLGRMIKSVSATGGGAAYRYRADGMRIQKATGVSLSWFEDEINDSSHYDEITNVNRPTTRYYYDGQMAMEEDFVQEDTPTIGNPTPPPLHTGLTRYGLGARGLDYIDKTYDSSQVVMFPLYDGHGNMLAALKRNGTGYTLRDERKLDVWGQARSVSGNDTKSPNQWYCANLGHVSDDESGLTYMRARFYEPWTGRFVSEDPAHHGSNWFIYCGNSPVSKVDPAGKVPSWLGAYFLLDLVSLIGCDFSAQGIVNSLAAYEGISAAAVGWSFAYAGFLALGIYSGLSTAASMLNAVVVASVDAAKGGYASQILSMADQMKTVPAMAPFAHLLEVSGWLGFAMNGDQE
jgi:RHS repeat-associated protein